ncbi:beta-tubulin, partial [Nannochloropsis gaditana CCMP526]
SEAKVVDRLRKNSRLASVLRKEACITDSSGRANNWAMGFTSSCKELAQSRGLFYSTVNVLRRELERIDSLQSLVIYHSLAGGTGSGVGSALFQYLREACPSVNITTCSVG